MIAPLTPAHVVLAYCQDLHGELEDWSEGDFIERLLAHESYRLTTVPAAWPRSPWALDEETVADFAARRTPFPAIVCAANGLVIDGTHRLAAAQQRGDASIEAFVALD